MNNNRWSDDKLAAMFGLVEDNNKQLRDNNAQLRKLNGKVSRHDEEIFGNSRDGLVKESAEHREFMVSTKSSAKTVVTIVSVVGLANLVAIVILVAATIGG